MYSLVRYVDDNIIHIVPTKSLQVIVENQLVWAPYKRMGYYEAVPLLNGFNKASLQIEMNRLKREMAIQNKGHQEKDQQHQIYGCDSAADDLVMENNNNDDSLKGADYQVHEENNKRHDLTYEIATENRNYREDGQHQEYGFYSVAENLLKENNNNDDSLKGAEFQVVVNDKRHDRKKEMATENKNYQDNLVMENNNNDDSLMGADFQVDVESDKRYGHKKVMATEVGGDQEKYLQFQEYGFDNIAENINSDDSLKDPDFQVDEESDDTSTEGDFTRTEPTMTDENQKICEKLQSSDTDNPNVQKDETFHHSPNMDYKNLTSFTTKLKSKSHFCLYCNSLQTKYARHLELKHHKEESVKQFLSLNKNDILRKKLIGELRKKGDFIYNTNRYYNHENYLIVVRRPNLKKNRVASYYKPCGNCGGMYASSSLAQHFSYCFKNKVKGSRDVLIGSRRKSLFLRFETSNKLKNEILPVLRDDEISSTIKGDSVIILFGNRLCQKYRSPDLYYMIREKLRCVGRFLVCLKKISPAIKSLEQCFAPNYYDDVIKAVNIMCGLDENIGRYKTPATARAIGSNLKKIAFYLSTEYIKTQNEEGQKNVKNFIHLLVEGLEHDVYKTVQENQLEQKRRKKIDLPDSIDIQKLISYLEKLENIHRSYLEKQYSYSSFKGLMSVLLTSLQIFNRRRAGEMERIRIEDFLKYESVLENDELLENIPQEERMNANKYVRFLIRGKLGRGVPVMLKKKQLDGFNLILKLRQHAGISCENPFLFGIPGININKHLSATCLLRKYSSLCGAKNPRTLRGTTFRKHFATKCASMNLGTVEIRDIADYMGHNEKIHNDHYRLPNATKDIVRISNILEKALGNSTSSRDLNSNMLGCMDQTKKNINNPEHLDLEEAVDTFLIPEKRRSSTRLSWTCSEKQVVSEEFKFNLENYELPSFDECRNFIEKTIEMKGRTPQQLRLFIWNQIQKSKTELLTPDSEKCKKVSRKRWTQDEKNEVFRLFKNILEKKMLPSEKYCQKIVMKNPILKNRTAKQLKAFIYNKMVKGE